MRLVQWKDSTVFGVRASSVLPWNSEYTPCTSMLSILLYSSETWTLSQADWKRLDSFHLRCQRHILHISWYDFVSNDEVLRRSGLFVISCIIHKQRLGLPDFEVMHRQTRSSESVSRWGTVTGLHRSGDAPAVVQSTHHLDPPDLPWHRCYSDGGPGASRE